MFKRKKKINSISSIMAGMFSDSFFIFQRLSRLLLILSSSLFRLSFVTFGLSQKEKRRKALQDMIRRTVLYKQLDVILEPDILYHCSIYRLALVIRFVMKFCLSHVHSFYSFHLPSNLLLKEFSFSLFSFALQHCIYDDYLIF